MLFILFDNVCLIVAVVRFAWIWTCHFALCFLLVSSVCFLVPPLGLITEKKVFSISFLLPHWHFKNNFTKIQFRYHMIYLVKVNCLKKQSNVFQIYVYIHRLVQPSQKTNFRTFSSLKRNLISIRCPSPVSFIHPTLINFLSA